MTDATLVLGAGSWGTALALVLARKHHPTYLWGRDAREMQEMREHRKNRRYLPDAPFPELLQPISDYLPLLSEVNRLVIAVPSQAAPLLLTELLPYLAAHQEIILACKGLLSVEVPFFDDYLSRKFQGTLGLLAGPSFAREVALNLPTAVVIAAADLESAKRLSRGFHQDTFRIYLSTDFKGVQMGGFLKNIYAVGAGLCAGLGLGVNIEAALISRALKEMVHFAQAFGVSAETIYGLSGCGDLLLSCRDLQSRNRRFGLYLGQGLSLEQAQAQVGQTVEARYNVQQVVDLAHRHRVQLPIVEQIHSILECQISPLDAVKALFARPLQEE